MIDLVKEAFNAPPGFTCKCITNCALVKMLPSVLGLDREQLLLRDSPCVTVKEEMYSDVGVILLSYFTFIFHNTVTDKKLVP